MAASMALLFSIGFFHQAENTIETPVATNHIIIEDPETASIEAQKALLLISANFNKGMKQLNMLSDNLEKTNEILNKTLK